MKRIFTNLGLIQTFSALMLIIAILFVSNYSIYKNSITGLYDQITENNGLALKSMVQSFDNNFAKIDNITYNIHELPYKSLISEENGQIDMLQAYMMQESISTLIPSVEYDYIEDIVVFYDDSDLVITSQGTSSFQHLFNNKYQSKKYTAEYWKFYSRTNHAFKLFPGENYTISDGISQKTKKLLTAIDGNKFRMSNKNIILLIDEAAFLRNINQQLLIPGSSLMVLDQNKNIILSTEENLDLVNVLDDVYFNSTQEASFQKENFEYMFYKSDYNNFIYISKIPYRFQNVDSVSQANFNIMMSSIICAIILSIIISIYLNRPIQKLLYQLGDKVSSSRGNDYRKIHSEIVKIQAENESYEKEIVLKEQVFRRTTFLQVIQDSDFLPEHDVQMQQYVAEFFRSKHFIMMCVQLYSKESINQTIKSVEELERIILNALSEEIPNVSVFHEKQLQFIVMIGIDQPNKREKIFKRLQHVGTRLEKEVLNNYSHLACVSPLYTTEVANCKRAYRNIVTGLMYRNVKGSLNIIDAENIHYGWNINYPFEKIEKLSNYLLNSNLSEGKKIIEETIRENADQNIHHHQFAHIAKTMFYYMLRHVDNTANVSEKLLRLELNFLQKVDQAHDYRVIEEALIEIAKFIVKNNHAESASKLNPAFITQYIELHFMENLSLDQIAGVVGTTSKYFSNYFKKQFGVNYVDYLNKVRLGHAKKLLKETHISIAEICEKVGYLNPSTFTTTFKKYFGISPSEYRKKNEL